VSALSRSKLSFSLACGEYDRTDALLTGRVTVRGAEPVLLGISDAFQRHQRMLRHREFDVAELSLSSYLIAKDRGETLVGIPVFPYRMFRHQFILVRGDRGVRRPEDLAGRLVGTPMYQTTTMLWVRGMLQDVYGVQASSIQWYTDRDELLPIALGDVSIKPSPPGSNVEEMFRRGELDALVLIEEVPEDLLAEDGVERLFPDFPATEEDYYRRTGIFPMMHAVVMREELYSANRWLARNLFDAFSQSLDEAVARQRYPRVMNLAWGASYVERERRIFGGSPYVYGLGANRTALEAATRYSHEQGLTGRRLDLADIFVPELMDT
jgi:4,5-dihydroxyphthalate decarboxylase